MTEPDRSPDLSDTKTMWPAAVAGDTTHVRFWPLPSGKVGSKLERLYCPHGQVPSSPGQARVLKESTGKREPGRGLGDEGTRRDFSPEEAGFDLEECVESPKKEESVSGSEDDQGC